MSLLKTSVRIFKGVIENIHDDIKSPNDNFHLTMFYKLQDNRLLLNFELMLVDINPKIGKIINYITLVELLDGNNEIISNRLEIFVKEVKFNAFLFNDFKTKLQENVNKDLSNFRYIDLYNNITYYNVINPPIKLSRYLKTLCAESSSIEDIEFSF